MCDGNKIPRRAKAQKVKEWPNRQPGILKSGSGAAPWTNRGIRQRASKGILGSDDQQMHENRKSKRRDGVAHVPPYKNTGERAWNQPESPKSRNDRLGNALKCFPNSSASSACPLGCPRRPS